MIVHLASTAAIGYVVLLHIQLYQLFPALVILPVCIIVIVVHFIITSGKADAKLRLAKLFPALHEQSKELILNDLSSESKANMHQTRRASLKLGLNVIDVMQQIENVDSVKSSSNSCRSSEDEDYDDDDCSKCNSESKSNTSDNDIESSDISSKSNYDRNEDDVSFDMDDSHEDTDFCLSEDSNDINCFNNNNNNGGCFGLQNNLNSGYSYIDIMCINSASEQSSLVMENSISVEKGHKSLKEMTESSSSDCVWLGSISDESS